MRTSYLAVIISLIFAVAAPALAGHLRPGKLPADGKLAQFVAGSTQTQGAGSLLGGYYHSPKKTFGLPNWGSRRATWSKVYKVSDSYRPWKTVGIGSGFGPEAVVPEPGSIVAVSMGLIGLVATLRRKK